MNDERRWYLREDVYADPLVNQWYAWPSLVAPVPYSMYMTRTHRRLMHSFVKNAELHALANQDPALSGGGEYVDCPAEQVEQVAELLRRCDSELEIYGELAAAVKDLDTLLRQHKSGESLEPLYEKVPELLKGYVELFMDLYHQPSYRLIEGLLYKSRYYDERLQSVSFGVLSDGGPRPFVLSTPRLADDRHLHVTVPFRSEWLDHVFRARTHPISSTEIDRLFDGVAMTGGLSPRQLFTEDLPASAHSPVEAGVRLQYLGHAGFLIESAGCSVLVDPLLAYRTKENAARTYAHSDLPEKIDYLCITHAHPDHINLESLLQIRHKVGVAVVPKNNGGTLADPSLRLMLKQIGFNVMEVDDVEEIEIPSGRIVSIPFLGEHGDLNVRSKSGWFFELQGKKIYAGADSSNLEPRMYDLLHTLTGDLDVLAIGMECVGAPYTWLYGALNTEAVPNNIRESRRLNGSDFAKAANMAEAFRPKHVLIYALGMEPWYGYLMGLQYSDESEQMVQSMKMVEHGKSIGLPVERLCGKYALELPSS
ncbi:MAG TPA: MBL fold metallo-hydrolase [Thermoanaerobaculia bacterium]|jgi:L-ascorbate metabolism protein UlaG (beta-lactamase superfamily)|nr:MBL fold metallo-hydrolase [Thermoanaerobaculia bacterium]